MPREVCVLGTATSLLFGHQSTHTYGEIPSGCGGKTLFSKLAENEAVMCNQTKFVLAFTQKWTLNLIGIIIEGMDQSPNKLCQDYVLLC